VRTWPVVVWRTVSLLPLLVVCATVNWIGGTRWWIRLEARRGRRDGGGARWCRSRTRQRISINSDMCTKKIKLWFGSFEKFIAVSYRGGGRRAVVGLIRGSGCSTETGGRGLSIFSLPSFLSLGIWIQKQGHHLAYLFGFPIFIDNRRIQISRTIDSIIV
jgi:hypothetical protein